MRASTRISGSTKPTPFTRKITSAVATGRRDEVERAMRRHIAGRLASVSEISAQVLDPSRYRTISSHIDNAVRKGRTQRRAGRIWLGVSLLVFASLAMAQPLELRLSVETPPSHARNLAAVRWIDAIERRSNGTLMVRMFPNGQLYDSPGAIKALASGALDLSIQASPTLSRFEPNLSVIALPMFFGATREQVREILDGPLGAELYGRLAAKGLLVPGGHFEYAPNHTAYTTDKIIRSYADLRGVKLATPPSPLLVVMLRSMGAFPVATPRGEIVLQLGQGQIDGLGSMTDLTISGGKLWDAGIRYAFRDTAGWGVYIPLVGEVTWSRLSASERDAVRLGWEEVKDWAREYTATELAIGIESNRENGIVSFSPSADEQRRMRERLIAEQDSLVEQGRMDADFVARVRARLAELQ